MMSTALGVICGRDSDRTTFCTNKYEIDIRHPSLGGLTIKYRRAHLSFFPLFYSNRRRYANEMDASPHHTLRQYFNSWEILT